MQRNKGNGDNHIKDFKWNRYFHNLRTFHLFWQEIIKVREWIPHIGLLLARCVDVFVEDLFIPLRFVSKQSKTSNFVGMSSLIFWLQAKELRLSVCFNTFRNSNRSLNRRRMSPAQTITTEWTEEKCLEKRVQSKWMLKHKLGNRTNIDRWSKYKCIQTIAAQVAESSLSGNGNNSWRQRQRRLKMTLYSTHKSR